MTSFGPSGTGARADLVGARKPNQPTWDRIVADSSRVFMIAVILNIAPYNLPAWAWRFWGILIALRVVTGAVILLIERFVSLDESENGDGCG